jgi:hypothetical protein
MTKRKSTDAAKELQALRETYKGPTVREAIQNIKGRSEALDGLLRRLDELRLSIAAGEGLAKGASAALDVAIDQHRLAQQHESRVRELERIIKEAGK